MHDLPQNLLKEIKHFEDVFTVDTKKLKEVVAHFIKELEKGRTQPLNHRRLRKKKLMVPTYRSYRRGWQHCERDNP